MESLNLTPQGAVGSAVRSWAVAGATGAVTILALAPLFVVVIILSNLRGFQRQSEERDHAIMARLDITNGRVKQNEIAMARIAGAVAILAVFGVPLAAVIGLEAMR